MRCSLNSITGSPKLGSPEKQHSKFLEKLPLNFTSDPMNIMFHRRLLLFLALLSCPAGPLAPPVLHAQSEYVVPLLPPLDYHPELVNGVGKWYIHVPTTIPGWHYSLEQYDVTDGLWKQFPDGEGQYYGNNLPIKFYVIDGPMPPEGGFTGPPPVGAPTWQLRWLTFHVEMQTSGLSTAFRVSRDQTTYPASPNPIPADAWDAVLTDTLPAMPTGIRTFMFQGWDDPVNKIMWQTDVQVTITDAPPTGDSISTTPENSPEETAELEVFQKIKAQLIGAMTTPYVPSPPVPAGPKSLIRLRRTAIDSNGNGIPNWWEMQHNFEDLAAFNAAQSNPDSDGLSTADEFFYGTNPRLPDTDGDGLNDGAEIAGGTDPLLFDLPLIKLEYAWREADGTDARAYEEVATRTVTGTATNGTTSRPWSMTSPASGNTVVNVSLALNNNMGTYAGGTEMPWSAWETWSGSATARFRQTFSGDASANSGLPLRNHKFHRREIQVRLSADRPMPVVWKVHLRKTLGSATGRPGTAWETQTLYTDPEVLTLGLHQMETTLTLSPAETPNPGLPTTVFPDNEAIVEYTLTTNGTSAPPNGLDSDGDTIPNATEAKIRTDPQSAFSDGTGIRDADARVAGLSSLTMALVGHRRGLVYHGSDTKGSTTFSRTGNPPPADRADVLTSYSPLNGLLTGLTYPTAAPATMIDWRNPATMEAIGSATKIPDGPTAVCLHASLQQQRVWGILSAAPPEATTRTCLKLTRRTIAGGAEQTTAEVVTFQFNANDPISTEPTDLLATFTSPNQAQTVKVTLHPVDFIVPDVRPSDSQPLMARTMGDPPDIFTDGAPEPVNAPSAPNIPAPDYANFARQPTRLLKIAKMEDSLTFEAVLSSAKDVDHFRVRIKDLPAGTIASLKLRTEKADGTPLDAATKLNLNNTGEKDYLTPHLVLVADADDDLDGDVAVGGDENDNDPSHRAELGGKVLVDNISLKFPSPATTTVLPTPLLMAKVPKDPLQTYTIKIMVLSDCTFSLNEINTHIARLKERFPQVGVSLSVVGPTPQPLPSGLGQLGSALTTEPGAIPKEEEKLVEAYGDSAAAKTITVIYCKSIFRGGKFINGYTRISSKPDYDRNVFIGSAAVTMYTLAHEIGHALTGRGHYGGGAERDYQSNAPVHKVQHNLLKASTIDSSRIGGSKRLYQVQENLIRAQK